jgi:two-component system cell cycle response regulator
VKILIADDDPVSRRLLEATLGRLGHEVVSVADGTQAMAALLSPDGPRLAVLDWMMPGADGLAVCRAVRQRQAPYVYIILLTSHNRREDLVAGLDAEADDFLTKPLDVVELRARLRSGERVIGLQEGLLGAQEALRRLAAYDDLTGLWNRRMILDRLEMELHRARRESTHVSVALVDLDHFKQINDTHGHAAGDAVLRHAADRMRTTLRDYDYLGRYGGEEFLIVVSNSEAGVVTEVAERCRRAVAEQPVTIGDRRVPVTISVGVASTRGVGFDEVALMQTADAALYQAKAEGRNRVVGGAARTRFAQPSSATADCVDAIAASPEALAPLSRVAGSSTH